MQHEDQFCYLLNVEHKNTGFNPVIPFNYLKDNIHQVAGITITCDARRV